MSMTPAEIVDALILYLMVVASLSVHEWGHAYTADRLGDDTPRRQGRVTLNPLKHMDLIGTVLLPLAGLFRLFGGFFFVGWARPVMIDPRNLRGKSDLSWVTIAGPAMNLLLATLGVFVFAVLHRVAPAFAPLAMQWVMVNVALMLFNLMPIPPLDGSKFLMYWFGMSEAAYVQFARFGFIILIVLLNVPGVRNGFMQIYGWTLLPFQTLAGLLT